MLSETIEAVRDWLTLSYIMNAVRGWQCIETGIANNDSQCVESLARRVTTSKQYPSLDGMSFSLAIATRGSRRLKLHAIEIISLSDDGFAGRAWQNILAKEGQPFHAMFFELFFRAPF